MNKILLDTSDEVLNRRQVLKAINNSAIDRTNLTFNFIKVEDDYYCIFTTCDDERKSLPKEMQETAITYKALKASALN